MKISKITISLVALMMLSIGSSAQVAINADVVIPTESNSKIFFGVSGTFLHPINDNISVGVNAGFRTQFQENITYFQIPLMVDARYYVNGTNTGFYPEVLMGAVISHYEFSIFGFTSTNNQTNFALGLGAGYKLDESIDISARFEIIPTDGGNYNCIGARIGYWF